MCMHTYNLVMPREPRIDIITPYTRARYLDETYDSILEQNDVRWRWLIQADGDPPTLPGRIGSDERVSYQVNSGAYGPALTRNHALMRSTAPFVFALDDDDLLYPGALSALASALEQVRTLECYGAWGETYSFTKGSGRALLSSSRVTGILPAGSIADPFLAGEGLRLHCGSVLWRRAHLIAFGGWTGLRHSEDTNLVIACDALFPSVYVPIPVYGYRCGHEVRESARVEFTEGSASRHNFTRRRAQMLRILF